MKLKTNKYLENKTITNIWLLFFFVVLYFLLKYYIPYWNQILYPITLIVTFLHEFWHSFFALITWGLVKSIEINSNWSWLATTTWWIRNIVIMWGYIGSAIFWNILIYIWFKNKKLSEKIIYLLAWLMIFAWVFWFSWFISSIILFLLASLLIFIEKFTKYDSLILQFLWISSILYIIEDFNVWPSSDLSKFSTFLPSSIWMIIWLLIVIAITIFNFRLIFKK